MTELHIPAVPRIVIPVVGTPAPQGSKRHVGNGRMVESAAATLGPWRDAVRTEAARAMNGARPMMGAVDARIVFYFPRPVGHFGRHGNLLPSAPDHKTTRPDLSKLLRSTEDALTDAGVWGDDAQVVHLVLDKVFGARPGAHIEVMELTR